MSPADSVKSLSGTVSHVERLSRLSGHISDGSGSVNTSTQTSFRVDGMPAIVDGSPTISSGDKVMVIGSEKGGVLEGDILRNFTINLKYGGISLERTWSAYILGALCTAVGTWAGAYTVDSILAGDFSELAVNMLFILPAPVGIQVIRTRYLRVHRMRQLLNKRQ